MPFPFSSSGTIEVTSREGVGIKSILSAIENAIRDSKPTSLSVNNEVLSFRGGALRFVSSWNQLISISSGEIRLSHCSGQVLIHYRISFVQMIIIVSFLTGLLFGFLAKAHIAFVVIGWLWLFGANYLLTLYRFPRFLRAAAETAESICELPT